MTLHTLGLRSYWWHSNVQRLDVSVCICVWYACIAWGCVLWYGNNLGGRVLGPNPHGLRCFWIIRTLETQNVVIGNLTFTLNHGFGEYPFHYGTYWRRRLFWLHALLFVVCLYDYTMTHTYNRIIYILDCERDRVTSAMDTWRLQWRRSDCGVFRRPCTVRICQG